MSRIAYDTELGPLVGNDAVVVLLLSQLVYWHGRKPNGDLRYGLVRDKEGMVWLAKSAKELEQETLLTSKQIRRGLDVLVATGVISTKLMRFMGHATMHVQFVCLEGKHDVVTAEKLLEYHRQKGNLVSPKGQTKICQKGKLTTETTTETTKDYKTFTTALSKPETPPLPQGQAGKNNGKGNPSPYPLPDEGTMMEAAEVLNKHKLHKQEVLATPAVPTKPSDLLVRWKRQMAGHGLIFKSTNKELFQFTHLFKALTNPEVNPDKVNPNAVIDFVFANWMKFTSKTIGAKGLDVSPPGQPAVWFLLANYDIALQLIAKDDVVQQQMAKLEQKLIDKPKSLCNPVAQPKETKFIPSEQDIQDAFNQLAAVQQKD